jgi:hypothetical protein
MGSPLIKEMLKGGEKRISEGVTISRKKTLETKKK